MEPELSPQQLDSINRLRMMLRENPKLSASDVRKAFSLPSEAAAKILLQHAKDKEREAVDELVSSEQAVVDRKFLYMGPGGTTKPLRLVLDDGKKVIFRDAQ